MFIEYTEIVVILGRGKPRSLGKIPRPHPITFVPYAGLRKSCL